MIASSKQGRYTRTGLVIAGAVGALVGGLVVWGVMPTSGVTKTVVQVAAERLMLERVPTVPAKTTNLEKKLEDWLAQAQTDPTQEQMDAFLERRGRDAESLAAMLRLTWREDLFQEMIQRFPDEPLTQAMAVMHQALPASELKAWAAKWVASDPDNALARYMAASVKAADDPAGAVNELVAAMSAGPINDYRNEIMINQTSFFESIGMPRGAAELSAARRLSTPSMGSIRKGARSLIDYTTAQRDAGKVAEADRANAAVLAMGQRQAQDSKTIIEQLVGIDIEKRVLKSLETSQETPAFLERSVADYQANLEEQTTELKSFMGDPAFKRASAIESESILLEYIHRMHRLGERPAQEWLDRQR